MTPRPPRPATSVGTGILLSRLTGLARDVAIAAFLGTRFVADAYWAAIKIPNIIRNLLGEGTLSAAFVPVYSAALEDAGSGAERPRRLARSVLGAVLSAALLLSGLGVAAAPWITAAVMPGADASTRALTTSLVRILFPMSGVLILGAWCLGVLNSHRRFFLPFVAPVAWNLAQVAGLLLAARLGAESLARALAWSALVGAVLQVGLQLPASRRLAGSLRPAARWRDPHARTVLRNTVPVISSQGIFQISTLVDVALATLAGTGAMAALGYAQRLVYLPISLFGISVAASSLPEMSRDTADEALRDRLVGGWLQIQFFVLPAAVFLLAFGDLAVTVLFGRGEFGPDSTELVTAVLAAYALGLSASASLKLFASGFHALQDTATPMRLAAAGVGAGIALSAGLTLWLRALGYGAYAAVGLALGGAVGAWLNLGLLWVALRRRLGGLFGVETLRTVARLAAACVVAVVAAWGARAWLEPRLAAGFGGRLVLLLGTLAAGGVPYLVIARRPPERPLRAAEAPDAE